MLPDLHLLTLLVSVLATRQVLKAQDIVLRLNREARCVGLKMFDKAFADAPP